MERLEARHFSFQSPGVLSTPSCWAELSNMWHRVIWASLQLERVGVFFAGFFFSFSLKFLSAALFQPGTIYSCTQSAACRCYGKLKRNPKYCKSIACHYFGIVVKQTTE